jgi:hypothetical protein
LEEFIRFFFQFSKKQAASYYGCTKIQIERVLLPKAKLVDHDGEEFFDATRALQS